MKYQSNPEIKEDTEKVPKNLKLHKKELKKIRYQKCQEKKKVTIRLRIFFNK